MPILLFWQAFSWLQTGWVAMLLPLIKKVPWQVWAVIACAIGVMWYGHVREKRGYDRCQAQVKIATDHELARQTQVTQSALREALKRAADAQVKEQEANDARDKLQQDVDKLKEASQKCLPKSITDRYRR